MPIKKTTKKVVKKTTSKKSVTKTVKKAVKKKTPSQVRALVCAAGADCFWTTDGQVLKDLSQLEVAFGSMEDEVFLHHVTKEKNDFADWVEHVLEDAACAADLRRSQKLTTAKGAVKRHLRLYSL